MAEKVIAIKIDVQGTADQNKKLVGLEKNLKKLKDERTKLNKAVKDGVISTDQYAKSIAKVNLGLKGTQRQLLVTRQEMLGIDGFTTRLAKSFGRLGTSISGAFVGLFAIQKFFSIVQDGIATIKDFEQQMATVKAITGATATEFIALEKSAKDLGSTTQFTATEVGKLQEEYAKLGFTTNQILAASEATLELATATGSDLAQSATVAAATLNGFGLEAKDTQRIVDVMAKSFTSSALDLSKFETAMSAVAPVAAVVGVSVEQATAALGTLTDAGFDASTAGTALRNILLDTQKAGLTTAEAFKQIRESADPATTALDLFGKRGAAVGLTLANNEEKTKAFASSLNNAAGSAKAMANIVGDTLEGDLKRLSSVWEGLILQTSEGDFFREITQSATEFLSTISDLTSNIHEESDALEDQRIKINVLVGRITSLNEGTDDRKKLITELNALSPTFLKNLDQENLSNEVLAKRLKEVNKELVNQILIKREDEKLADKAEDQADAEVEKLNAEISLEKQLLSIRESKFKGISKEISIGKTQIEQANELLKVLDEQSIRVKSQTSFGGVVESTNLQADAADRLRTLLSNLSVRTKQVNEQNEEANDIAAKRVDLLKRLGVEESKTVETKKKEVVVNKELITTTKTLSAAEQKKIKAAKTLEDKENERKLKEEERFISKVDKIRKQSSLLAIEDERKLQLEKLRIQKEALDAEAKLKIGNKVKQDNALLSLTTSFNAKETAINASFDEKQRVLDEAALEQTEAAKQKKIDDIVSVGQFALTAATELVSSIASIELQTEREKLEKGLITEKQFAVLKYGIEKKAFERQKKIDITQAIMNGALGVTKAFAQSGVLGAVTGAIVAASTAVQVATISKQQFPSSFAEGGYTGEGSGNPDSSGFKQAGIVHEGEYVVPKHVLGTQQGANLVGSLEAMRNNRPSPNVSVGFANGGLVSGGSNIDLADMENRITTAVVNSIGSIPVINNATDTISQANKVVNVELAATFG